MFTSSAKERILEAVERLPQDASVEDAMGRLYLLSKIERGLVQVEAREVVPHEEVEARFIK